MEYTIDEIKAIVRELLLWDGRIEELLALSDLEEQTSYPFDGDIAEAKLKAFATSIT